MVRDHVVESSRELGAISVLRCARIRLSDHAAARAQQYGTGDGHAALLLRVSWLLMPITETRQQFVPGANLKMT